MSRSLLCLILPLVAIVVVGCVNMPSQSKSPWVGKTVIIQLATQGTQCLGEDSMLCFMRDRPATENTASVQFRIVPGLGDPAYVSFESVAQPSAYLRHSGSRLRLHPQASSRLYKADSSFQVVNGLAGEGVSFVSLNYPSRFIAAKENGEVWIIEQPDKNRATFNLLTVEQ